MRKPFQMYSKLGDLKVIQLKPAGRFSGRAGVYPIPFVGVINHKITTGLIVSSKINRVRKDGMSLKFFKNDFVAAKDFGKLRSGRSLPFPIEYKSAGHPLLAKKFIKSCPPGSPPSSAPAACGGAASTAGAPHAQRGAFVRRAGCPAAPTRVRAAAALRSGARNVGIKP